MIIIASEQTLPHLSVEGAVNYSHASLEGAVFTLQVSSHYPPRSTVLFAILSRLSTGRITQYCL